MGRELGFRRFLLADDDGIGFFADPVDLADAAARQAILPDKPSDMQRYISSMTGRNLPGLCAHLPQQIEEALAAAHLLMKGRDQ